MAREYFPAYHSYLEAMEELTDAEKGRLFTACLLYSKTGEAPQLSGNERYLFPAFRSQIDRDNEEYAKKCAKNRKNGELGGKRTGANGSERGRTPPERLPNAPQEKGKEEGKEKGKGKGEEEGDGGYPLPPTSAAADVLADYLNRVNPSASQRSLDELRGYAESMGADVCLRAIDIALDSKKANWPYIRAILRDKQARGVRCLADWDTLEAEHRTPATGGRTDWAALAARMDAEEGTK